jgi:Leucine-rich repeat (LRR) protein
LIRLNLAQTGMSLLTALAGLPYLEDLDLHASRVLSLDAVAALPSLRCLDLARCSISQLDPLARLTKLESLTLGTPALQIGRSMLSVPEPTMLNLAPIQQLHSLRQLRLFGLQIDSLARLNELVGIEELIIEHSKLGGGLRALPRLPRLELLSLANCEIDDFAPLAELPRLRILQLGGKGFGDLAALAGCESLEWLTLRDVELRSQQIESIRRQLPRLTQLRVNNRLIEH